MKTGDDAGTDDSREGGRRRSGAARHSGQKSGGSVPPMSNVFGFKNAILGRAQRDLDGEIEGMWEREA
jgi:hypothetical protein